MNNSIKILTKPLLLVFILSALLLFFANNAESASNKVTVTVNNSMWGTVWGGGYYTSGQEVTIGLRPAPGYKYKSISLSGGAHNFKVYGPYPYLYHGFTMPTKDVSVYIQFEKAPTPNLTWTGPITEATNVPTDASIVLGFNEYIHTSFDINRIHLRRFNDNVKVAWNNATLQLDRRTIILSPKHLSPGTKYYVQVEPNAVADFPGVTNKNAFTFTTVSTQPSTPADWHMYVISLGGFIMRSAAGNNNAQIATIPYGQKVRVHSVTSNIIDSDRWADVEYNNQRGWVKYSYLSDQQERAPVPSGSGNGLFAEYFQYTHVDYPFSAVHKRDEVENDTIDSRWTNFTHKENVAISGTKYSMSFNMPTVSNFNNTVCWPRKIRYVNTSKMAVRWNGTLKPRNNGNYRFRVRSDGGVSFFLAEKINDNKYNNLIDKDNWKDNSAINSFFNRDQVVTTKDVTLNSNKHYHIVLEYFNHSNDARVILEWSDNGGKTWSKVPKTVLYSTVNNRSVSVQFLGEVQKENMRHVERKARETNAAMFDNYLEDQLVKAGHKAVKSQLGPRTKIWYGLVADATTDGYKTAVTNAVGERLLGDLFKPVKSSTKFIKIFEDLIRFAKDEKQPDARRALAYLLTKEKPNANFSDMPLFYAEIRDYNNIRGANIQKPLDLVELPNSWLVPGVAGTHDLNKMEEFTLLTMSAIAAVYKFQYTDYLGMLFGFLY